MYVAYFVNHVTGWLFKSYSPKDNPQTGKLTGWYQITSEQYYLYIKVTEHYGGKVL